MIKDFNTEKFINYLVRKNLKLNKDDIKIFCKEKIASSNFLKLIKEDFCNISFTLRLTTRFTEFIKGLN